MKNPLLLSPRFPLSPGYLELFSIAAAALFSLCCLTCSSKSPLCQKTRLMTSPLCFQVKTILITVSNGTAKTNTNGYFTSTSVPLNTKFCSVYKPQYNLPNTILVFQITSLRISIQVQPSKNLASGCYPNHYSTF